MTAKSVFLQIMNHFIHPEAPLPATDGLEPEALAELLRLARIHAVFPVVFDAVHDAPAFQALPEPILHKCRQEARRQITLQTRRTYTFLDLYRRFLEHDLQPLVVKGIIMRRLYAQPDYRASSDEDLLIPPASFSALDQLLQAEGFTRDAVDDPLSQHEITFVHPALGLHLEVHLSLFAADSPVFSRLNREFSDVFQRQTTVTVQDVPIHTLCPTQHMLYLLCHGLKHFLHSGFGIRQLCDMAAFAEQEGSGIDWDTVITALRRQNMYVFFVNLCDIAHQYLGFSYEKAGLSPAADVKPDAAEMLEDLLCSGIYGKSTDSRVHSANITLQAAQAGKKQTLPLTSLFPDLDYMCRSYPYLRRHRWLLPVAWVQRGVSYLRHSSGQEVSETVATGSRRVEMMKKYGLIGK